ncbi:MAG: FAD-binding oxidoreductase [bacterium]|nr:FAD-binding oxidoreductase [bacterium]
MALTEALKRSIGGELQTDEVTLKKYSHDASLFEIKPSAVFFPKDVDDIKHVVNVARESGGAITLTPRAGGTDMTGGSLSESLIVDTTRYLNTIIEVRDGLAVTQPGVYYRDFEQATLKHNLLLPSYPASREICTVGGMVGNNAGGEKTLSYGKTEKYVERLKMVLADGNAYEFHALSKKELDTKKKQKNFEGEVYRNMYKLISKNSALIQKARPNVTKNSAGYYLWNVWDGKTFDLTKLFVGSQGTLGIVSEITFRLVRPKTHSQLAVIFMKDMKSFVDVAHIVLKYKPESFESFDDHTFKLAINFLPSFIKILKKNIFKLAWQFLPEFAMVLTGGIPKLILLAEFTGDSDEEITERLETLGGELEGICSKSRIITSHDEMEKYWTIRRESFNLLRKHIKGKRTAPFIDDLIVRVERFPEFFPRLQKLLDRYQMTYTIAGHVGDANLHIIPFMDLKDLKTHTIIQKLSDEVYNLVFEFGGSMTAEHNDGLIRSPYLKKMYGEKVYKLFEETKKIFDPFGIFNPGKKVGANLQYAFDHIVKE